MHTVGQMVGAPPLVVAGWLSLVLNLGIPNARAASVSVNPSSGPGNCLVSVMSSGFLPDQPTGTIYANTGFYADDGFMMGCTNNEGASWANCTVLFRMPTGVGPHVIRASNSYGEVATTTFTVATPTLTAAPAFGPAGTQVSLNGRLFAAAANVGIYINGGLYLNAVTDESGSFTASLKMPALANGAYELVGRSGDASASAAFTLTNCVGSVVVDRPGGTSSHPGSSPQPLRPGVPVPVQAGDTIQTGAGGRAPVTLVDGTELSLGANAAVAVEDYHYDANSSANSGALYNALQGPFQYISGLITKTPNPDVNLNTTFGKIGIRGTQFIFRQNPCSTTQEIDLIEGQLAVTPHATPGVTNVCNGPMTIFLTASNITTALLNQTMYDAISNEVLQASATVTFSAWLEQYFGCTNNNAAAAPQADPDGDGQDNYTEFLAGTDPTTSASAFRLFAAAPEGHDVHVSWMCGGGRTNVLQTTTNLDGTWTDVSPPIILAGSGDSSTNFLDSGAVTNAPARYYRVRLLP